MKLVSHDMKTRAVFMTAFFACLTPFSAAQAEVDFSGYIEAEARIYPDEGLLAEQRRAIASFAVQPELSWKSDSEDHNFRFKGFARYSDKDGHRDHADIRELYYSYANSGWQVEAGINKVYWGVVESLHLVDIINQTDYVESVSGDDKLGQPMISLGIEKEWGNLDIYLLPYFRERVYSTGPERFRPTMTLGGLSVDLNDHDTFYESGAERKHIDYAARWAASYDAMDISISYFSGTNRDPIPVVLDAMPPSFMPNRMGVYYEQLHQLGIAMQYLYEDWAFKFEGTAKHLNTGNYNSMVTGFEYTLSDLDPWGADLGLLMEYLWNDRRSMNISPLLDIFMKENTLGAPYNTPAGVASLPQLSLMGDLMPNYLSPFENDLFFATRFSLNDVGSTQFLAGIIVDADNQTTTGSFEGSTRIGDDIRVTLNIYFFSNVDKQSAFYAVRKDSQIETRIDLYF